MIGVKPKYHIAVLVKEFINSVSFKKDGIYVDVTFGGGTHSSAILEQLGPKGRLYAFDQDADAAKNVLSDSRFKLIQANFRHIHRYLDLYDVDKIDGLIADLGVSSHQFDASHRGFSYKQEAELDMRMNQKEEQSAKDIVNNYSEKELADMFYHFGDLKQSRKIASRIIRTRTESEIKTITEFTDLLLGLEGAGRKDKFLARVFQAIRIELNQEIDALKELLDQSVSLINPGGWIAIISYHSLEDRIAKNFLRSGKLSGKIEKDLFGNDIRPFNPFKSSALIPTTLEQDENPRSRSARMRIGLKNEEN